jgi:hypothetical protein
MKRFNNQQEIIKDILEIVEELDVSPIEASIIYSDRKGIDIEVLGDVIKKNDLLKSQIQIEAENLNYLKKIERLPF